ncbi:MAG: BMP family ABC transporter substrate-binding protein [Pseudanabaenaceae cyanobacterium bins.39]|nr:BMP family ABC transporter substrate-binding protein [Pseudanabaenaceae cyanobacterium bins.39]
MGIFTHKIASKVSIKHLLTSAIVAVAIGACGGNAPTGTSTTPAASSNTAAPSTSSEFKAAMILVGPQNDSGWNQGHFEASKYVMDKLPGVKFDYVDKVNPGDRPNVKASQVADDLISKGAKLVIFNSDDFKDDALETAKKHPSVAVIHASGDYAWKEGKNYKNQKNLSNTMPEMEYGRMISGCAAALHSETGKIGFLGPLINDETRRLVSSSYLGAKYCWQNFRKKNPDDLKFKVVWIGFWFNIPGQTLDPTKVADDFYNNGFDVVLSGIDTPEVAVQAKKANEAGKKVKYLHYGLKTGCNVAPEICIGVPYYNWNPSYLSQVKNAMENKFTGEFISGKPDWKDLNNPDTSAVGFEKGKAMTPENDKILTEFIKGLGDSSINLFKGPLNYQDGTPFLKEGEVATPQQIWYFTSLLQGIEGATK